MSYTKFTNEGKKASFAEMLNAEDASLHNSNMLNVVNAAKKAKDAIAEYEHKLTWWKEHQAKIEEFGNTGDMQDTETVSELFKARPPEYKKRNW